MRRRRCPTRSRPSRCRRPATSSPSRRAFRRLRGCVAP
jgi:hypothetical protein